MTSVKNMSWQKGGPLLGGALEDAYAAFTCSGCLSSLEGERATGTADYSRGTSLCTGFDGYWYDEELSVGRQSTGC